MKIYKVNKIVNDNLEQSLIISSSKRMIPETVKADAVNIEDVTPPIESLAERLRRSDSFTDIEIELIIKSIEHSNLKRRF